MAFRSSLNELIDEYELELAETIEESYVFAKIELQLCCKIQYYIKKVVCLKEFKSYRESVCTIMNFYRSHKFYLIFRTEIKMIIEAEKQRIISDHFAIEIQRRARLYISLTGNWSKKPRKSLVDEINLMNREIELAMDLYESKCRENMTIIDEQKKEEEYKIITEKNLFMIGTQSQRGIYSRKNMESKMKENRKRQILESKNKTTRKKFVELAPIYVPEPSNFCIDPSTILQRKDDKNKFVDNETLLNKSVNLKRSSAPKSPFKKSLCTSINNHSFRDSDNNKWIGKNDFRYRKINSKYFANGI
ncbi:MAG: hypothetical protein MHMPM18_000643 [Marteilia pararefringens]